MRLFSEFVHRFNGVNPQIIFSWSLLCFISYLTTPFLSSLLIPSFSRIQVTQQHVWGNRCTSFLHSIVMSLLFIFYWLSPFEAMEYSTKTHIGDYEYFCMNLMVGYLLYDTCYEFYQSFATSANVVKENKRKATIDAATLQILAHHVLGLLSHWLIQFFSSGTGSIFLMGIYGAEMSTPFLNISWLLLELKLKDSTIFFVNGLALLTTFLWRNILGAFILYQFHALSAHWVNSASLSDGSTSPLYDNLVFYLLLLITLFFASLNVIWTLKLLKKAFGK
jgi:hypothetical protein